MPSQQLLRRVVKELEAGFDARAYLDDRDRTEVGANWAIDCPVCFESEGKEKKLHVLVEHIDRPKVREPGTWTCFFCEESGGALDLVQRLEDLDFLRAVEVLRKFSRFVEREADFGKFVEKALASLEPASGLRSDDTKYAGIALPEEFISCAKAKAMPAYFAERGIDRSKAVRYGLGFCTKGFYRNRLVIPVTRRGVVVGFQARWMRKTPPEDVKKYLNDDESKRSLSLFGLDQAVKVKARRIVLVEDVFSAMFVGLNGVALRGTHLSTEQVGLLAGTDAEEIVICLDADAHAKAEKMAAQLVDFFRVRIARLPDERDPDDYVGREASFARILERAPLFGSKSSFEDFVKQHLS